MSEAERIARGLSDDALRSLAVFSNPRGMRFHSARAQTELLMYSLLERGEPEQVGAKTRRFLNLTPLGREVAALTSPA